MHQILKKHTISVKNAVAGVVWAFNTQPNFRIHLFISTLAVLAGYIVGIGIIEWIVIIATIMGGLVIELINTAIEATTDAIDLKIRPDIKIAKDVAAGAMLIYASGAVIIAYIIFSQYFFLF